MWRRRSGIGSWIGEWGCNSASSATATSHATQQNSHQRWPSRSNTVPTGSRNLHGETLRMKNTAGIGRIASSAAVALPPASATVRRHSAETIAPPKAGNARTDLNAALTQRPDTAIRSAANSATDEMRTALAKLASDYLSGSSRINPFKTLEGTLLMGVIANTNAAFTEDERRAAFVEAESRGILTSGPRNNAISAYITTQSFHNIGTKTLFAHIAQHRSPK